MEQQEQSTDAETCQYIHIDQSSNALEMIVYIFLRNWRASYTRFSEAP